ncbi:Uncharacterised protein [uncultured Ruminococcus sp.]|nr:Uncharacterised protein [uncultured Ruminococcus sp.]
MVHIIVYIHLAALEIQLRQLVLDNRIHIVCRQQMAFFEHDVCSFRIDRRFRQDAANQFFPQEVDSLTARAGQTGPFADEVDAEYVAVVFANDDVLRYVDETTGQVARVSRTQSRVGQTLTGAVARRKVIQYGQAFAEVRLDRQVDDTAGRVSHQAAHAGNLTNLLLVAAGAGVSHHKDGVERVHVIHHGFRHIVRRLFPNGAGLAVPFVFSNQAAEVHFRNILNLLIGFVENIPFFSRNLNVRNSDGHAGLPRVMIADSLDAVKEGRCLRIAYEMEAGVDKLADFLLIHQYAKAVDVDKFFSFFEGGYRFFIYLISRQRTNCQEVYAEGFLQLGETIV